MPGQKQNQLIRKNSTRLQWCTVEELAQTKSSNNSRRPTFPYFLPCFLRSFSLPSPPSTTRIVSAFNWSQCNHCTRKSNITIKRLWWSVSCKKRKEQGGSYLFTPAHRYSFVSPGSLNLFVFLFVHREMGKTYGFRNTNNIGILKIQHSSWVLFDWAMKPYK